MKYKKVSMEILTDFRKLLELSKMDNLLNYFDNKILEVEKTEINKIKQKVYQKMNEYKNLNDSKYNSLYSLYQGLKINLVTTVEAQEIFNKII